MDVVRNGRARPLPTNDPVVMAMRGEMDTLRGRLFVAVEATGMPEKQANAFKQLVRTTTYDSQAILESILKAGER